MGKRTMKEWIVIEHSWRANYKNALTLFKEEKSPCQNREEKMKN
jgi:hypothetical protein